MSYKIISDSCCDYGETPGELPQLQRVPLTIEIDGAHFRDDETLAIAVLLEKMAASETGAKSACPPPALYADSYEGSQDDVYVVTLSDRLSGSYNSAVAGKTMYLEQGRPKNIHVFNSRSASAAQVAICLKIHELAGRGKQFDDVVAETERFIEELTTLFVLEDLESLRKNGRLSHLQSIITGVLKIKLVMGGDPDGTIGIRGKALSTARAISRMVELIREKCSDVRLLKRTLVITHCNCRERAEQVKKLILSVCPFERTVICRSGGISTIYANAGGIIVSF